MSHTSEQGDVELQVSAQIEETLDPCVVLMKDMMSEYSHLWEDKEGGIYSLAQGIVYWEPPDTVADACYKALFPTKSKTTTPKLNDSNNSSAMDGSVGSNQSDVHLYGPANGLPELLKRLSSKLEKENNLDDVHMMVTAGANQAYVNCILTALGEGDQAVVFLPYYFNHVMAIQMIRGADAVVKGPTDLSGIPDCVWLEKTLKAGQKRIKLVTVVNPGNPSGCTIPYDKMIQISEICKKYGVWLVVDCTYEHFDHDSLNSVKNTPFTCVSGEHVINIFSFSKAFSLAGFRVGYLTLSKQGKGNLLYNQMLKVQDTIPICVSRLSQIAATGAMVSGRDWVNQKVLTLSTGRQAVLEALKPLDAVLGGNGAMYVMAKLPNELDDVKIARLLVEKYGVAVIPGSFCGFPTWIRVCYSNLNPDECIKAASRLASGIENIVRETKKI